MSNHALVTHGRSNALPVDTLDVVAQIDGLHVVYHTSASELHAVRGVQLAVQRGEIVALVGESGSGKTTIAMALLGLLGDGRTRTTAQGKVEVLGVDLLRASETERRRLRRTSVGAVFQDPMSSLNPTMPVGQQIAEIAGSQAEARTLLESVGVSDAKRRLRAYPHELSGGQRQRVMIAMAIAREPALVVADEPTTALDVTIQAQILRLIAQLRERVGCAFVLVTHDLGVAAQVADRVVVCYSGRVAEVGETRELLARPVHPYTSDLLNSRLRLESSRSAQLPTLPGDPPNPRRWPPGCPFAPRCAHRRPVCEESPPDLIELPGGRSSACVRIHELTLEPSSAGGGVPWPAQHLRDDEATVLQVRDVYKSFQTKAGMWRRSSLSALRGVSLDVERGDALAIVGESGSGKSTLLRAIAGLTEIDAGSISIASGGRPQMVFQDAGASLTPWLSCGEQVGEPLRGRPRSEVRERIVAAFEMVGLSSDVARLRPGNLSGGQRQRVALARAIAVPPPILLCDEPTSSLDVSLAATVLNLIGTLRRELGMAILFVTHDLSAARFVADRIAVMYLGRIVELGPAEELVMHPTHPYTKALVAAVPDVDRPIVAARGEPGSGLSIPNGCAYHPRCLEALGSCAVEDQILRSVRANSEAWLAACVHVGERR